MDSGAKEQMASDERRDNWYVIKGIPVAVLLGLAVHGASFAWYLSGLNAQVQQQGKEQAADRAAWTAGLSKLESKVDALSGEFRNGSVPAALNSRRLDDQERNMAAMQSLVSQVQATLIQQAARIAENERRLATTNLRQRALSER